ncbi:MAG: DUF4390 domain-containing protein [Methylophilaceae bacterium]
MSTFCFITLAWATGSSLHIKTAALLPVDEAYILDADFDVNFSSEVENALSKGVSLTFLIEFQIVSPRQYWFDDEIVSASRQVTISYHALSRQYLLNQNNHQQTFASLQDAKEELSHLRGWQVVDKVLLKKGEIYHAALRIRLDQSRLPKPLQVDAIGSEDWDMVSERYRWTPALALQSPNK